ncbi:MAG TPA: CotH kinase family protein [Candidatus Limnocylindria bacterium]|jgi:hypothetical protein|nr:CotH kinase family protein [Candidatus Limnocylindria bacterium]
MNGGFCLWVLLAVSQAGAAPGVRFDHQHGLFPEVFDLKLKANPPGSAIRYTTDGSEPSATNGLLYSTPLHIAHTTVLRAISDSDPGESPTIETRSFIFPTQVPSQTGQGFPQSWGLNDNKPVPASYTLHRSASPNSDETVAKALQALPSISIALPVAELFGPASGIYSHSQETGDTWERAASVEFLPTDATKGFRIDAGVRVQGGWSRRPEESPKHSLRLVFHKRYGGRLKYPLFGPETETFSTLILRGGNNNTWLHPESVERRRADYLRDAWMRQTYGAMGRPTARDQYVHVYLNGLYWGLYDLAERPDAHFISARLGGSEKDYDTRNADKILTGDDLEWKRLFAAANAGVTNSTQLATVAGMLNLEAFADYMILNLYGANADIDRGSNWYAARRRNPAQPMLFLMWDGERTLEGIDDDRLAQDDDECPTRLFQKLRENPEFRRIFAERAKLHLTGKGALSPEVAAARYKALADALETAIPAEAARWGAYRHYIHAFRSGPYEDYTREEHWRPSVQRELTEYFPQRTDTVIKQFREAKLLGE